MTETERAIRLFCLVTGNECGTDTWAIGQPCTCSRCQTYLRFEQGLGAAIRRAALEEAAQIAEKMPPHVPGGSGVSYRMTTFKDVAAAIRALADQPAAPQAIPAAVTPNDAEVEQFARKLWKSGTGEPRNWEHLHPAKLSFLLKEAQKIITVLRAMDRERGLVTVPRDCLRSGDITGAVKC